MVPAAAEVLPVPEVVAQLQAPMEEHHALRAPTGATLGEQRFQARVAADRLTFDIATRFASAEEWDEHGEMDLTGGFRSRLFDKVVRRDGRVVQEQHVDFTTGKVAWLVDGVQAERAMQLPPDTYIGPMLALVLASVPERTPAASSFQALVFRPDPVVVTLRVEAVDEEEFPLGTRVPVGDQAPGQSRSRPDQERPLREPHPDPLLLVHPYERPHVRRLRGQARERSRGRDDARRAGHDHGARALNGRAPAGAKGPRPAGAKRPRPAGAMSAQG